MSNIADIKGGGTLSQNEAIARTQDARLKGGGGGGTLEGMEQRINRLEDDMKEVRKDLVDIKVSLARIEGTLASKVDYKWLTVYVAGIVAVIMREEIRALFAG